MKLSQNSDLKAITLSWTQLCLANIIIKCSMPFIRYPKPEQKSLNEKIQSLKYTLRPGAQDTCLFSDAERKAMRAFNLDYCCMLVNNIQARIERGEVVTDGLEAYMLATAIQLKFRS